MPSTRALLPQLQKVCPWAKTACPSRRKRRTRYCHTLIAVSFALVIFPFSKVPRELLPPRPWDGQGSELQVDSLVVHPRRPPIVIRISRPRESYGRPYRFHDDSTPVEEFRPYRDKHYDLIRREMDNDCQASGITADAGVQTRWFRKVNSCVQYESLTLQDLNIRLPSPPQPSAPKPRMLTRKPASRTYSARTTRGLVSACG